MTYLLINNTNGNSEPCDTLIEVAREYINHDGGGFRVVKKAGSEQTWSLEIKAHLNAQFVDIGLYSYLEDSEDAEMELLFEYADRVVKTDSKWSIEKDGE